MSQGYGMLELGCNSHIILIAVKSITMDVFAVCLTISVLTIQSVFARGVQSRGCFEGMAGAVQKAMSSIKKGHAKNKRQRNNPGLREGICATMVVKYICHDGGEERHRNQVGIERSERSLARSDSGRESSWQSNSKKLGQKKSKPESVSLG